MKKFLSAVFTVFVCTEVYKHSDVIENGLVKGVKFIKDKVVPQKTAAE